VATFDPWQQAYTRQVRTLVLVGFALLVGSCARYERAGVKSSSGVAPSPGLSSGNYYCASPSELLETTSYPNEQACLDSLHADCTTFCNSNPEWFFVAGTGEGCGVWDPPGGWFPYCVCQIDCVDKAACPTFPGMCLTNTCSGNNVALNSENQPCEEFCIGWGVHNCFILDGPLVACDDYGKSACMCGTTIGFTPGCVPIIPSDDPAAAKWPPARPPLQKR